MTMTKEELIAAAEEILAQNYRATQTGAKIAELRAVVAWALERLRCAAESDGCTGIRH